MALSELAHLQLLAEIDALVARLQRWADAGAPLASRQCWPPAETCQALVRRLAGRAEALRTRLEAPLVVATLGGTGTGKSALVNALAGAELVATGRQRPTTLRPTLICRPGLTPEMLGIDPANVELLQRDLPALADLVLLDCPDPDTTEEADDDPAALNTAAATNLARLRQILPHCDVLLVTTTQQKYRSARVSQELAAAAAGARLVFVETHADQDQDIRDDWRAVLSPHYSPGQIFLVDSLAALADAQGEETSGPPLQNDFPALRDLLTRQLAGAAAARIRRANFLDLADQTLDDCRRRLDESLPPVEQLQTAIEHERSALAARLAQDTRAELLASRRSWENRLLGQATARWGLSPFSLLLRIYQGFGTLVSGAFLYRARTPAQLALWGAVAGARSWHKQRQERQADQGPRRALAACWDQTELRAAGAVLAGYAAEAGFARQSSGLETVAAEAERAGLDFAARVAADLDGLVARLAERHTGWFTRWRYELLLCVMLGLLAFRLGKNFFYDSWWATGPAAPWGLEYYLTSAVWLTGWCLLLLWAFTRRLRRGLARQIAQLAEGWSGAQSAAGLFARLEDDCRHAVQFRGDLLLLQQHVAQLRRRLALPDADLGHKAESSFLSR